MSSELYEIKNVYMICVCRFAATELQSNLLVEVADCRFHLHKVIDLFHMVDFCCYYAPLGAVWICGSDCA